jgi:glucosamine 6-phosphate synthetase-like amidotransferase/phosphosugar isomerase protein
LASIINLAAGRNTSFPFPIALEGALKLKEIAYIDGEGYVADGMKHGPAAPCGAAAMSISRATWPRASPWNDE